MPDQAGFRDIWTIRDTDALACGTYRPGEVSLTTADLRRLRKLLNELDL